MKLIKNSLLAAAGLALVFTSSSFAADKSGSFTSKGRYKVSGSVKVSSGGKINISGFSTTPGPDLYIYVGNGSPSTLVAKLKKTKGSQSYSIPANLVGKISTVHVHCKRYNKLFGTAKVK